MVANNCLWQACNAEDVTLCAVVTKSRENITFIEVPEEACTQVPHAVCTPRKETECVNTTKEVEKCEKVYDEECQMVPYKQCSNGPHQQHHKTQQSHHGAHQPQAAHNPYAKPHCEYIQIERCTKTQRDNCTLVPEIEETCNNITVTRLVAAGAGASIESGVA